MTKRVITMKELDEMTQLEAFEKIKQENPALYNAVEDFFIENEKENIEAVIITTLIVKAILEATTDLKDVSKFRLRGYNGALVALNATSDLFVENDPKNLNANEKLEIILQSVGAFVIGELLATQITLICDRSHGYL